MIPGYKYILKGSDYVRLIKRRKTDRVYWEDVLPHERVTEEDIKKHIPVRGILSGGLNYHYHSPEKIEKKYLIWQGCQRAELLAWKDEKGFPDWKYKPCHMKVSSGHFCKRHLKSAEVDGKYTTLNIEPMVIE